MPTTRMAISSGIGLSTVHRRVKAIMDSVGADTRLQAGLLLAARGRKADADPAG